MSDSSALPKTCPQCGLALPTDATEGLCPHCLMAEVVQATENGTQARRYAESTVGVPKPAGSGSPVGEPDLPLPEELAALLTKGDYLVEGFLGQGGMGAVYQGTQVRLKRPVAIKIMRRDQGRDHDFEQRFEREALALAKLNHPNIVSVIDYGEAGPDYLYIVMELIDGADLMDVIRTGRMTQQMALTLLPQICDALQFAHDHGIVHRDVKPSNIMLTRDGRIKMADFGLAKRYDADSNFRTQTGTGMGSPDYAAPEQFIANVQIDHRADIYALGVMIYQMITGQLPRGVWKPPSQRAEVDTQWDDIVNHAMQNDPADRFQKASEVKSAVNKITPQVGNAGTTPPSPPVLPLKSRARQVVTIFAGIIILATGAFFALKNSKRGSGAVKDAVSVAAAPHAKQTLDLIALVDVQRDRLRANGNAGANQWVKSGSQLAFASVDKRSGKISAPVALNGLRDYEVEVGVSSSPNSAIVLDFPTSPTKQASIAFVPGKSVAVRNEKQELQEIGAWPNDATGPPWKLAVRATLSADGINGTLTATINGLPAGEWRGALARLGRSPEPHPEFPGQLVPSLFVPFGDRTHSSWILRIFDGEAKVLRSAAPSGVTSAAPSSLPSSPAKGATPPEK